MEETHYTTAQIQTTVTTAQPMEVVAPLTDEALSAGGMEKVTAFVRTAQSANALRKQRAREKAELQGFKQLNIQLPVQAHQVMKDIAQELQRSGDVALALHNALNALQPVPVPATTSAAHRTNPLSGWQLFWVRCMRLFGRPR